MNNLQSIKAVARIASIDSYNPVFNCIYANENRVVATDGYLLAMTTKPEIYGDFKGLYPASAFTGISKQDIAKGAVDIAIKDNVLTKKTVIKNEMATVEYNQEKGDFPNYKNVLPKPEDMATYKKIGLGVGVLKKLLQSLEDCDAQYIELFLPPEELKPIAGIAKRGNNETCDVKYLIMPYKI